MPAGESDRNQQRWILCRYTHGGCGFSGWAASRACRTKFSPRSLGGTAELAWPAAMGISFLMYSPLGGLGHSADPCAHDRELNRIADRRGISPQVAALAWELSLGDHVIAIPG